MNWLKPGKRSAALAFVLFIFAPIVAGVLPSVPALAGDGGSALWINKETIRYPNDGSSATAGEAYIKNDGANYFRDGDLKNLCSGNNKSGSNKGNIYAKFYSSNTQIHVITSFSKGDSHALYRILNIALFDQYGGELRADQTKLRSDGIIETKAGSPAFYGCKIAQEDTIILQQTQHASEGYKWINRDQIEKSDASNRTYSKDDTGNFIWTADINLCKEYLEVASGSATGTLHYDGTRNGSGICQWKNQNIALSETAKAADAPGPPGGTDGSTAGGGGKADPCRQIHGFAFIFCPILNGVDELITSAFKPDGFVNKELVTSPLSTKSQGGAALKQVWEKVRDLTNVFFVLIFLVVVFANIASINIDAYSIKKALPRLVAAVLLVQFSYVICSLIIDVGNIFGRGVYDLLSFSGISGATGSSAGAGQIIGVGLLIGAGAIITGLGAWLLMVPILLSLVVSVVMVIITLAVRHFLINVLVVMSPLAFAAWVLPNTEKYFKKWWENYSRLVMMYPFIIMLMAVASIMKSFGGLIGLLAPIIALAAVPATLKAASVLLEKGVGLTRGKVAGASGLISGKVKQGEGYKNAQLNVKSKRLGAVDKVASFGEGKGKVGKSLAWLGARGTSGILGAPGSSTSAASRQRDLQQTMKGQREQLDLLGANAPDELEAIINGDAAKLHSIGRSDLAKFASNPSARLAAMQKKGEVFGLDVKDVKAIAGMTKNGALRSRYWSTVNSGAAYSKTAALDPALVRRSFDRGTGKFADLTAPERAAAAAKVSITGVANMADTAKIDQLVDDQLIDANFAHSVLENKAAQGAMSAGTKQKLITIAASDPTLRASHYSAAPVYNDDRKADIKDAYRDLPTL